MIYVKRVEIASITLNADGTADYNLNDVHIIIPVNIKKVIAIGLKPFISKNNLNVTNSFDLGTVSIIDSYGNIIGEYILDNIYSYNTSSNIIRIKALLRKIELMLKGGDIVKLIPQFSREVVRAISNYWGAPTLQDYLNGNPKICIDVYLEY